MLHPYPSIPKTHKYVSPAAASWPGGSTFFGIEGEGGGGLDPIPNPKLFAIEGEGGIPNSKTKRQDTKTIEKHKRQEKTREEKRREEKRREEKREKREKRRQHMT